MSRPRRGARCAVALVAVALSGCADRRIDLRNIEAAMRDRYGRDAAVPIEAVTCPEWVRTRKGDAFECQVRFQGGVTWTIAVTQLDEGNTQWVPRGQAVFAEDIEPWAVNALAAGRQPGPAPGQAPGEVRCDARVYVIEPGQHVACAAVAADGSSSEVRIGFDRVEGLRLLEQAPAQASPPGQDAGPGAAR
jgi:hypothetical protein